MLTRPEAVVNILFRSAQTSCTFYIAEGHYRRDLAGRMVLFYGPPATTEKSLLHRNAPVY